MANITGLDFNIHTSYDQLSEGVLKKKQNDRFESWWKSFLSSKAQIEDKNTHQWNTLLSAQRKYCNYQQQTS